MSPRTPQILGILNLTRDSFSDGGRYLDSNAALAHAEEMIAAGADIIDIGAAASHPDAAETSACDEIARLRPVVVALLRQGCQVSVDTWKPEVMRAMLDLGVQWINDITALRDPDALAIVRDSAARIIAMHSLAPQARATPANIPAEGMVARIGEFFRAKIIDWTRAGMPADRLILDPGLVLFLSTDARASVAVLAAVADVRAIGLPVCVGPSRKSFVGAILGDLNGPLPVAARGSGSLACEIWAATQGVEFIRTHDVRPLRDALRVWHTLESARAGGVEE